MQSPRSTQDGAFVFTMDQAWIDNFREKLDNHYQWPALYMFKFIVPAGREQELKQLFPRHIPTERSSSQGKYTSITFNMMMPSSDSVIDVYQKAAVIPGVIAL